MVSPEPMYIIWGPQRIVIYNDENSPIYGKHHPNSFGRPFEEPLSPSVWNEMESIVEDAYKGISSYRRNLKIYMNRKDFTEKAYVTFSYTPVYTSHGDVGGIFCRCRETTEEILLLDQQENESNELKSIFNNSIGAAAIVEGDGHYLMFANPEFEAITGRSLVRGTPVEDCLNKDLSKHISRTIEFARLSRGAYVSKAINSIVERDSISPVDCTFDIIAYPIRLSENCVDRVFI